MIGTKLYKNNPDDMAQYTATAKWCNANNAHIEDKGEYYEVVENVPYVPTKDEQIQALTEEYAREKSRLCEEYTTATMQGDSETAESVVEDLTALDEWFDEEYEKIEGGDE